MAADGGPVSLDDLPPFGHDHSGLCSCCGGQHILSGPHSIREERALAVSDAGIIGRQFRSLPGEGTSQLYRWSLSQVVGPGLEGQAEDGDFQPVQIAAEAGPEGKER